MTPVLLAELVAAVSVATDISMCHPVETGLATSVTATRLARRVGAGGDELAAAYYLALRDHIGCTAGNLSFTAYVGDEMTGRERVGTADATEPRAMAGLTMRNVFGDGPSPGCAEPGRLAAHPAEFIPENVIALCEVAQRLTSRLGVGPRLHDGRAALPARDDGKGRLCGCSARRSRSPRGWCTWPRSRCSAARPTARRPRSRRSRQARPGAVPRSGRRVLRRARGVPARRRRRGPDRRPSPKRSEPPEYSRSVRT